MFSALVNTILAFSLKFGYAGVLFLMTIESSFIPFPSELVIPPAAYLAQQGEMNIYLVIFFAIIGSILGALINYYIAISLGRAIIYKIADHKILRALMINSRKVERAEKFFLKYGNISTLIGRLVPVVRQLISLPAGFSKMKLKNFLMFTTIGSGAWVIILAYLGYSFGANEEKLVSYYGEIKVFFLALAGMLIFGFALRAVNKNKHRFWKK